MRYFDFIKEIKEISTSHILVNEYGEGDIYEYLNNGEHKYPCVFLTVTNLTTTDSSTAINFTLFYTDRLVENQANKTSIQSTGISVIKQILSKYEQLHPEYLLSNVNYTPFTEKFTDMCAGVFCDVVIENQIDTLENYDNECEEGAFTVKTITLTKNGVYDIVGYDSAVVLVETEDVKLKKIKVSSLEVNYKCFDDRGFWDGSGLDTVNVTDMSNLFGSSSMYARRIDVSGWDTSNVTSMDNMFSGCILLIEVIGISDWNTSNVTNMRSMFRSCRILDNLNLSKWNIGSVTDISGMFSHNFDIKNVNISGWDTSNVTDMSSVFNGCTSLQQVDVSGLDTSNVTDFEYIFYQCTSLLQIDLSGWNAKNATHIDYFSNGPVTGPVSSAIINYVGGRTIDEVISNNIGILNGLNISNRYVMSDYADRASLRALINGLADLTGETSKTLSLSYTLTPKLTEEDIAVATDKNWTIL